MGPVVMFADLCWGWLTWMRERMLAKWVSIAPPCGKFWFILFMSWVKQLKALASERRKLEWASERANSSVKTHGTEKELTHRRPGWLGGEPADHTCPEHSRCRDASRYNCDKQRKEMRGQAWWEKSIMSTLRDVYFKEHHKFRKLLEQRGICKIHNIYFKPSCFLKVYRWIKVLHCLINIKAFFQKSKNPNATLICFCWPDPHRQLEAKSRTHSSCQHLTENAFIMVFGTVFDSVSHALWSSFDEYRRTKWLWE